MSQKEITLADIAEATGLSKGAVSCALRNSPMVSKQTCKRVQAVAKTMGYKKNELVSALMSKMRKGTVGGFLETIAVINGNLDEFALERHPTLPRYYQGIKEEAERLGYAINEFWLHSPDFKCGKISKIFRSRGIRGGIVLGHSFCNTLPDDFNNLLHDFYFVSAGIRTYNQSLEVVASDDFLISYNAYTQVSKLGYKRIGIILEEWIDDLVGGTLIGGFLRANLKTSLPYIEPFLEVEKSSNFKTKLESWISQNNPDAILYLLNTTRDFLKTNPLIKKKKIKLVQLERRGNFENWMGVEQNNDLVGKVAVRRLADMLNRNSVRVGENSNMITLVKPTWVDETKGKKKI